MRWSIRTRPRSIRAPATRAPAAPRRPRGECADFVDLARRMSIPDDHAIRQFVDVAMAADRHPPQS
jgi:hypothetical protein